MVSKFVPAPHVWMVAVPETVGVHWKTRSGEFAELPQLPASELVPLVVPLKVPPCAGMTVGLVQAPAPGGVGGLAVVVAGGGVGGAGVVGAPAGVSVRVEPPAAPPYPSAPMQCGRPAGAVAA